MSFKIHPGIGIARVGDSPSDWFIGPETLEPLPIPAGGYRDAECRIKRQGARFRIREYDALGHALATEVNSGNAVISWTVSFGGASPDLTLTGPNQAARFTAIPFSSPPFVSVAELRTDGEGHLIVLSGVIEGSFNGVMHGWVQATVQRGVAAPVTALESCVVLAPPDFAPARRPICSYYARLFQSYLNNGLFGVAVPAMPSFRKDVYPLLRAKNGNLPFSDSIENAFPMLSGQAARSTLAGPTSPLPPANLVPTSDTQLLASQYQILSHWVDGNVQDDWATRNDPIELTPAELDRGPLSHAVGAPLGGWEMGSAPLDSARFSAATLAYTEAFRFDRARATFTIAGGSVPWQADLSDCVGEWPSQAGAPMPFGSDWQTRGFMVLQGDAVRYVEDCTQSYVVLLTASVDFGDVSRGPGGSLAFGSAAIVFEVGSATSAVELVLQPLPAGLSAITFSQTVGPLAVGEVVTVNLWLTYATGALGSELDTLVHVQHTGGSLYTIAVHARTVESVATELALVLDCSYSMTEDRGDGLSKLLGLKDAVDAIIDVARAGDGIGVAPFSSDALPTLAVTPLGPNVTGEPGRGTVRAFVNALHEVSGTSIGDGLVAGRSLLSASPGAYPSKALIVVTDGKETEPAWISDVASNIDQRTFAIGIGTTQNINAGTLQTLTGNRGGYLLMTGAPGSGSNRFILDKYLLQIVAGMANEDTIVDPEARVLPGTVERIPFPVTEAELAFDAIVLADEPQRLVLALETPTGEIITQQQLTSSPRAQHVLGKRASFFRVELPLEHGSGLPFGPGLWQLLIGLKAAGLNDPTRDAAQFQPRTEALLAANVPRANGSPVPYCAVINTRSVLNLRVNVQQTGLRPGSRIMVEATLHLHGAPFNGKAELLAEVTGPAGLTLTLPLQPAGAGRFVASYEPVRLGVYQFRVRARGTSSAAWPFQREFMATAAIGYEEPGPSDFHTRCCAARAPQRPEAPGVKGKGVRDRLKGCVQKLSRFSRELWLHCRS